MKPNSAYCSELEKFNAGEGTDPQITVCTNRKGEVYLFAQPHLSNTDKLKIFQASCKAMEHVIRQDNYAMKNAKVIDASQLKKRD